MNRRQQLTQRQSKILAYRQAFERLDAALEENAPCDNREKIRLMRLAYFASVDALQASGKVVLPE